MINVRKETEKETKKRNQWVNLMKLNVVGKIKIHTGKKGRREREEGREGREC